MLRFPFCNLVKNAQSSHFQPHIHTTIAKLKFGKYKWKKKKKKNKHDKHEHDKRYILCNADVLRGCQ